MKLKNLTSEDGQTEIRIFLDRNNKIQEFESGEISIKGVYDY